MFYKEVRIGDVHLVKFTGVGSEQQGWRPGVVFQNNVGNAQSPNIIVLPLTSAIKNVYMPTHVFLSASQNGLRQDSMVMCENPERVSKERLGKYITSLSDEAMAEIAVANLLASSAIAYIDEETLLKTWVSAKKLNRVR